MTTKATVGGVLIKRASAASPASYDTIPEVISISGVGQANDLIDATSFDSGGNREYVGGLADGQEVTIECNYIASSPGNAVQEAMIASVVAKETGGFRVEVAGMSPVTSYTFQAAYMSWALNPSVDNRNTITYTIKISGAIT